MRLPLTKIRTNLTGNKSSERKYQTRHGTTAVMDVSNIGAKPPSPPGWLGLKPGLARIRWAVLRTYGDGDPYVEDYGEIRTPARVSVPERLGELERDLVRSEVQLCKLDNPHSVSLLHQFRPTVVAVEIPQNHPDYPPPTQTIEAIPLRGRFANGVIELVCYRELEIVPLRLSRHDWR